MFRKLVLAIGAAAVICAAAFAPTAASAHWHGHHWGHWHGFDWGFYAPTYIAGPDCYIVKRTVEYPDGSLHLRRFRVCN